MTDGQRFEDDLYAGIEESKRLGYNPTRFIQMVKQYGAVEATKRVVDTGDWTTAISKCLVELVEQKLTK